nr:P1 protein [Basella rugose mosaic virus]
MASVVFFGTIPSTLVLPVNKATNHVKCAIAPAVVAPPALHKISTNKAYTAASRVMMESYDRAQKAFEARLDKLLEAKREAAPLSRIVKFKGGYRIRWASAKRVAEVKTHNQRKAEMIEKFMNSPDKILYKIEANIEESERFNGQVSLKSPHWKRTVSDRQIKNPPKIRTTNVKNLLSQTFRAVTQNGAIVEIIGKKRKRAIRCSYKTVKKSIIPCFDLPHKHGIWSKRELVPSEVKELVDIVVKYRRLRDVFTDNDIQPGWSGFVVPRKVATSYWRKYDEVIVRGRLYGKVEDARTKLPFGDVSRIHHY